MPFNTASGSIRFQTSAGTLLMLFDVSTHEICDMSKRKQKYWHSPLKAVAGSSSDKRAYANAWFAPRVVEMVRDLQISSTIIKGFATTLDSIR